MRIRVRREPLSETNLLAPVFALLMIVVWAAAIQAKNPKSAPELAWMAADAARLTARTGDHDKAIEQYSKALRLAPDEVEIRRDFAVALSWAERYKEASVQFRLVLKAQPRQPRWALQEIARTELAAGEPARALEIFALLTENGDVTEKTMLGRALGLARLGRLGEAAQAYRETAARHPRSELAVEGLLDAQLRLGELAAARDEVDRALEAMPLSSLLIRWKSWISLLSSDYPEAIRLLSVLEKKHAPHSELYQRGKMLVERLAGDPLRAVDDAARSVDALRNQVAFELALPAPDPSTLSGLGDFNGRKYAVQLASDGVVLARSDRIETALAYLEKALDLSLGDAGIRSDYAVVLGWAGRLDEASAQFDQVWEAIEAPPVWLVRQREWVERGRGDWERALALNDQLLANDPSDNNLLVRKASLLSRLGRHEAAEEIYRPLTEQFPAFSAARLGLIDVLFSQRRFEEALQASAVRLRDAPDDWDMWQRTGWMWLYLGRYDHARRCFEAIPEPEADRAEVVSGRLLLARLNGDPLLAQRDLAQLGALQQLAALAPDPSMLPPAAPRIERRAGWSIDSPGSAGYELPRQARALRDEGVILARQGKNAAGIVYLTQALRLAPSDNTIRRDYAAVLGWSERFKEARAQFSRVFADEPEQPTWALQERAYVELFGDNPASAIESLDILLARGDESEQTLSRKGLALRWLNRGEEAEKVYRELVEKHPDAVSGADGLIHSLADQHRLYAAIEVADESIKRHGAEWELLRSKGQVLNWAGRHLEAREVLRSIDGEHATNSEVLHHRVLAARWADNPAEAKQYANLYLESNPNSTEARVVNRELSYEYGHSLQTSFQLIGDSDGFSSRSWDTAFELPFSAAQRLRFGYQHRRFEQEGEQRWNRFGVGWRGNLSRRIVADVSAGAVDYHTQGDRRFTAEGSVSALLSDRVRVSGGGGRRPIDSFASVVNRTVADYGFGEVDFRPDLKTSVSARYMRSSFSSPAVRRQFEAAVFREVFRKPKVRLEAGFRTEWMWHDRETPDFYSPEYFQVHRGALRASGRLPWEVDYVAELGLGAQREPGSAARVPMVLTAEIARQIRPGLRFRAQAGYTNSSFGRINTGGASGYRYAYAMAGLDFRFF